MKKLTVLILLLFLSGCAGLSTQPSSDLEARMEALEKGLKKAELMAAAGGAAATDRVWPFYGLTGGGNALDGISEASIGANDTAIGRDSDKYGYIYYWDATDDNTTGCNSPACIEPSDQVDDTGSWLNVERFYSASFYSSAADGDHYTDPSNSAAFPTGMAEGSVTCRDDYDACFVYDGSTPWLPLLTGNYGAYDATGTISIIHSWGGTVSNDGASGDIVLTLQDCTTDTLLMEVTIACADNDGDIQVIPLAGDSIFETAGDIDLDCNRVTTNPTAVTVKCFKASNWVVTGDAGEDGVDIIY